MTQPFRHFLRLSCTAAFFMTVPIAQAQFGFGGDGLIDVKASEATYKGGITVLVGDVIVKQEDAVIKADKMTIYRAENANSRSALQLGEITRIVAEGKFSYTSPGNTVTGDRGIYKRSQNQIDVFGNVKLTQPGGNSVDSDSLFYDLTTQRARFKNDSNGGRINFNLDINNQ